MYDYATHTRLKQRLKDPDSLYPCESRARLRDELLGPIYLDASALVKLYVIRDQRSWTGGRDQTAKSRFSVTRVPSRSKASTYARIRFLATSRSSLSRFRFRRSMYHGGLTRPVT